MPDYRIMPNNIEAEQAVLGCILIDNQVQIDILGVVKEKDFYSQAHQSIYAAMLKIYQKSTPVDFVTLTNQLDKDGMLDKVGGIEYITTLTNVVPSTVNYKYYCDIIKTDSLRRSLIEKGRKIIENSYEAEDKEKCLQFAEKEIFEAADKEDVYSLEHVGVPNGPNKKVIDKFNTIAKDPTSLHGIPTGYTEFDKITNGLQNSDLIILAARPGVGKTSFAMNVVIHAATEENRKCAIFSLEMSKEQLMQRAMCSLAKVSMAKALNGTMTPDEWKRIMSASKKLEQSGLYIVAGAGMKPLDVLTQCRRLKAREGLDLIMVDYLQLMESGSKKDQSRQNDVSDISRKLKQTAQELNVPLIALSQLSRNVEDASRKDHRPVISDLRDSGAIEQDADIVLLLYNPEKYNDVEPQDEPGTIELIIAKHRNGQQGTVKLRWIGEYTTFVNPGDKSAAPEKTYRRKNEDEDEEMVLQKLSDEDSVFED